MATYKYMEKDGSKVQVESARRDGEGKNIASNYAKQNGYYETLTSGNADNLTPYGENSGAYDDTPFVFQTSGGSADIGNGAYLKALRGNSVAFNQLVQNGNFADTSNWTASGSLSVSNNIATFTANVQNANLFQNLHTTSISTHKYLFTCGIKLSSATNGIKILVGYESPINISVPANTNLQDLSVIFNPNSENNGFRLYIRDTRASNWDAIQVKNVMLIDLTLMFGAGNEPTSVLEFNRLFPKAYYEYNAGTLLSCKVNGIKNVGYNAFDGEIEGGTYSGTTGLKVSATDNYRSKNNIKVIAGEQYTLEWNVPCTTILVYYYDENNDFISYLLQNVSQTTFSYNFTTPNNCRYITIAFYKSSSGWGTNPPSNTQIAFHLTWDGSRTGYETYEEWTYALPNVELKSAGSVYDELKPDGTLIRRVGSVDLGTLSWSGSSGYFYSNSSDDIRDLIKKPATSSDKGNVLCSTLLTQTYNDVNSNITGIAVSTSGALIIYNTAWSTTSQIAGTLYYELATPTEEQDDDYKFQEIQDIDDFGTQEFLYDSDIAIPIPQGNEFFYPVDYKAFVDSLGGREDIEYDASEIVSQTELASAIDFKELASSNIGAITSSQVVAGEFYKNNIAITGGLTNAKYVIAVMSNGNKYPMIITSSLLVTYSGTSWQASNLTVTKIYYKE